MQHPEMLSGFLMEWYMDTTELATENQFGDLCKIIQCSCLAWGQRVICCEWKHFHFSISVNTYRFFLPFRHHGRFLNLCIELRKETPALPNQNSGLPFAFQCWGANSYFYLYNSHSNLHVVFSNHYPLFQINKRGEVTCPRLWYHPKLTWIQKPCFNHYTMLPYFKQTNKTTKYFLWRDYFMPGERLTAIYMYAYVSIHAEIGI